MMKLKLITLLILLPQVVFAEGIPVKETLAQLVEDAVRQTRLSINVVPDQMTSTSINISTINGVSVCDTSIKEKVITLLKTFAKNKYLKQTISIYGAYVRTSGGEIKFLPTDSPKVKAQVGACKHLYVSVK